MKAGIFTTRSLKPVHPRLAAFLEYFDEKNISYDLIPALKHPVFSRLNWLSLFFFDLYSVYKNKKKAGNYDIILINDLKYLPVALYGKGANKTVIYETIDNNVSLRGYLLQKKIPAIKFFMRRILNHYSLKEKKIASAYCDVIIVNSKALTEYFGPEARLLYYYSPFENISALNDGRKKPALLYLGEFSEEKGALEILALRKKLDMKLFIFGSAGSDYLYNEISNNGSIHHTPKIPQNELAERIAILLGEYFLAGCSFIRPVHQSYATQEANKDIDYLALGIPIIGNHRQPTEEKILAGCGIFAENDNELNKLLSDDNFRTRLSKKCKEYYFNNYSKSMFRNKLEKILTNYVK